MKPDAVLFDLFGTLVNSPPKGEYRQMVDDIAAGLGCPNDDEFFEKWMSVNRERLLGTIGSSEDEVSHVAAHFGITPSPLKLQDCVEIRRQVMTRWLKPKDGVVEVLKDLSGSGIRLALVSDCVSEVPLLWDSTPMAKWIDAAVFSCLLKVGKPDPAIYSAALDRLGVEPPKALFVGDGGSDELNGAVRAGIPAMQVVDSQEDIAAVLRVGVGAWSGPVIHGIGSVLDVVRGGQTAVSLKSPHSP